MWGWGYTKTQDQWNNGRGIMLLTSEFQKKGVKHSTGAVNGVGGGHVSETRLVIQDAQCHKQSKPRELRAQADPYLTAETQGQKKPWSRGKQFLAYQGAMIWLPEGSTKSWTPSAGDNDNNRKLFDCQPRGRYPAKTFFWNFRIFSDGWKLRKSSRPVLRKIAECCSPDRRK